MIKDQNNAYYNKKYSEKKELGYLFMKRLPDNFGPEDRDMMVAGL